MEMWNLAAEVARQLRGGEILLLVGELGSGKTTFTQGLARELGVSDRVTSPTFTVVGEYTTGCQGDIKLLVHVDLYRLVMGAGQPDAALIDVLEKASDKDRVTVIEWGDKIKDRIVRDARVIEFKHTNKENERLVII